MILVTCLLLINLVLTGFVAERLFSQSRRAAEFQRMLKDNDAGALLLLVRARAKLEWRQPPVGDPVFRIDHDGLTIEHRDISTAVHMWYAAREARGG